MLVVEYTSVSIGAASADLFSNVGGSAGLKVRSLWSYKPDRDLRLSLREGVLDPEGLTLQVGNLRLAFPAGSSTGDFFKWTDVDVDWEDGQTLAVRIVPTSASSNTSATGLPSISGTAHVGETLMADTTGIVDADGLGNATFSYQWIRSDGTTDTEIEGATDATYTLVSADVGTTIKVQVSFTDVFDNDESRTSAATAVVELPPNILAMGAPAISGKPHVLEMLIVSTSDIQDQNGLDGVTFGYQWLSNDEGVETVIEGATDSTYTLVPADEGKTISVRVSFTDQYGYPESRTSTPTEAVGPPNNRATGAPTISGKLRVRETLTADTSGIADGDRLRTAVFRYQWVRNDGTTDTDIQGAIDETYELSDDEVGKTIKVEVFFSDDAGFAESLTSAPTIEVVPLGTCLETDSFPPPTPVEVGAVPIVVQSTTDEYFVLFVRPDLDSDRQIPVSVTLGQDGTTPLAENVAALPKERYRVEKYLVAHPADVDGDCIDDITELTIPDSLSPVNAAAAIEPSEGAVAILDHETFEEFSSIYPISIFKSRPFIKFVAYDLDTDRPVVYFLNTGTHKHHVWFISSFLGLEPDSPEVVRGQIGYDPELAAPDGTLGLYWFWTDLKSP